MANIKPTKLQMFNGLRRRPKYEEISQEINPDKTKIIYPNRDATRLRNDPRMTQMDGLGMFESVMEQQDAVTKEQRKETIIQEIAKDEGIGIKEAKSRPPPAPPPSGPSGSGANPRMPYATPQPGPRMFPPKMPYTFEFGAQDPQTDHEAAIAEARNMSKQQRQTRQERNDANMARHLAQQQDKMADLIKKQRQTDLDNRRTMPDENLSAADESFAEAENDLMPGETASKKTIKPAVKKIPKTKKEKKEESSSEAPKTEAKSESESDKPAPKRRGRPIKKDTDTKKPTVKKEEPAEIKEIKKEEAIKKELKAEIKKERSQSVPPKKSLTDKAMRERSKSKDESTPPKEKRRSKKERSRSRDPPTAPGSPAAAAAKGRVKKEFVKDVKREVAKIDKKQESSDPEVKHEPKGPRGRPRSESRPPATNAAASSSGVADTIDRTTSINKLSKHAIPYLLKQLELRGFEEKQLTKFSKGTKLELMAFISDLIRDDRW